jgi:hypothetical protein
VRKGSPGAGGWPTIRYFNKKTGYEGADYKKKTGDAMCTELGPGKPYMEQYVTEAGETSLCDIESGEGCTDKEKGFIATWKEKLTGATGKADLEKQITRLNGMSGSSMKESLAEWLQQRIAILSQFKDREL